MANLVAAMLPRQATDVLPPVVAVPTEIPTAIPTTIPTEIPTIPTLIPPTATALPTSRPTPDIPFGWVIEGNRAIPWWYSRVSGKRHYLHVCNPLTRCWQNGEIVKWSLFLAMIFFVAVFLTGSYMHAKRRMKKGLAPLGYHRVCLLGDSKERCPGSDACGSG
jgi:hypothetical protein